jgi:thiosulfate dehydrogenase
MTLAALFLAAQMLIPQKAPIGTAHDRVKNPMRDPLPQDPALAEQIRRGYRLFLKTPRYAPEYAAASLSCGNCHLNAGQKEGAMPLVGIASIFPEYNRRSGRSFTLEERIVG